MKVLVLVALFAFVAVQVVQSAPVPEDDKVENTETDKKEEPAAPEAVVAAEPAAAPADAAAPAGTVAETKSESASPDVAAKAADIPAPAEEKDKE